MKKSLLTRIPLMVVIKGNSDGSILKGDIIHYDIDGSLVLHTPDNKRDKIIKKIEFTPDITDFLYVENKNYEIIVMNGVEHIVRRGIEK